MMKAIVEIREITTLFGEKYDIYDYMKYNKFLNKHISSCVYFSLEDALKFNTVDKVIDKRKNTI